VKQKLVEYLTRVLLKRRKNLADRFLIAAVSSVFPERMRRFRDSLSQFLLKPRVTIISLSDCYIEFYTQLQSGDYWVKFELIKAFGEIGCAATDVAPDIAIHLFGFPAKLPKDACRIIWIYSNPDRVNAKLLAQYDKIFCLSASFIRKINQMGFEAEPMIGATAKRPVQTETKYDIVFVGNVWRKFHHHGRTIVRDLGETPYNFKVWGKGWNDILPARYYAGQNFDNQQLAELYASSLISLADHLDDMRREGFVAVKIFDILASGGFCISDKNPGISEIFGDSVPQYESPEHLRELIDTYIQHPDQRLKLMEKGRKIALSHTWQRRAEQFLKGIDGSRLAGNK